MNILFTCAGRRTYLLKYFKEQLGNNGLIVATDMQETAPALSVADIIELVPAVYAENYIDATLKICKKYSIDILISLNDLELPILAANKEAFEQIGVIVTVSSPDVIDVCFDKYKTSQYVESLGLLSPKTYIDLVKAKNAIAEGSLTFPLVLKPRWGSGSIGIEFVDDEEELDIVYKLLQKRIRKSILSAASLGDDYILIQEKIRGSEYGLDIMNDLHGNHIAVSVKHKLAMRAGETDKATTIDNSDLRAIGRILGENLHHIANLDCDILEENGKYYVLELNPRFGGGFPFSYEAGVNMPKAIIEWAKGNNVPADMLQPEYNRTFAKCDYLVER